MTATITYTELRTLPMNRTFWLVVGVGVVGSWRRSMLSEPWGWCLRTSMT
jgi:hypothetical protein